jgi:hypothetical protein
MKTFVMTCGCRLKAEELRTRNRTYRCPHHMSDGVKHVEASCDGGCGKIIVRTKGPFTNILCDNCKKRARREKDRVYYKKRVKKDKVKIVKEQVIQAIDLSLYTKWLSLYLPTSTMTGPTETSY